MTEVKADWERGAALVDQRDGEEQAAAEDSLEKGGNA